MDSLTVGPFVYLVEHSNVLIICNVSAEFLSIVFVHEVWFSKYNHHFMQPLNLKVTTVHTQPYSRQQINIKGSHLSVHHPLLQLETDTYECFHSRTYYSQSSFNWPCMANLPRLYSFYCLPSVCRCILLPGFLLDPRFGRGIDALTDVMLELDGVLPGLTANNERADDYLIVLVMRNRTKFLDLYS